MNWADILIAVKKGIVASGESVTKIINGTTKVGNADKLDGLDSGSFPRYYTHATDYNGGVNGNKVDFNTLTQVGFHLMAGNFSEALNKPNGFYGDSSVIVTGNSACLSQIVVIGDTICFRKNAWNGDFGEWQYGGNADTLDGLHASNFLKLTGGTLTGSLVMSAPSGSIPYAKWVNAATGQRGGISTNASKQFCLYNHPDSDANSNTNGNVFIISSTDDALDVALRLVHKGTSYNVLHTGTSAKVVVSTTAPTDTKAVWIVP